MNRYIFLQYCILPERPCAIYLGQIWRPKHKWGPPGMDFHYRIGEINGDIFRLFPYNKDMYTIDINQEILLRDFYE